MTLPAVQDDTLVSCKSGQPFPGTSDDYRFFNSSVVETLRQYQEDGFKVVVFRYVHCRMAVQI